MFSSNKAEFAKLDIISFDRFFILLELEIYSLILGLKYSYEILFVLRFF